MTHSNLERTQPISREKVLLLNRLFLLSIAFLFVQLSSIKIANSQETLVTSEPPSLDIDAASARKNQVDKSSPLKSDESKSVAPQSADPIVDNTASVKPIIDIPNDLKQRLDQQFNQIQLLYETEDAFSEKLSENYLSYGKLLMQVARTDEAQDAFINALHITKVNNGIDSIEQRPILRELFEISYALRELKEADKIIKQIINLEKKHPQIRDTFSFDMLMRIGHLYMGLYLENPVNGESGLFLINNAIKYFKYTKNRYGDKKNSELLLPYGELAYLLFLKNQIRLDSNTDYRSGLRANSFSEIDSRRPAALINTPKRSRNQSLNFMTEYYEKAEEEDDIENMVRALLNTGDLYLMYQRQSTAKQYYYSAWEKSQLLPADHELIKSFDMPVRLPNFKYALVKSNLQAENESEEVLLHLTITDDGRVRKIRHQESDLIEKSTRLKAHRTAKRLTFRPILENGKPLKSSALDYLLKLPVRKKYR